MGVRHGARRGVRHAGRIVAFQTLYRYEMTRAPLSALLNFSWLDAEFRTGVPDAALEFARLLITGCIEQLDAIDALIQRQLEHWDIARVSRVDLSALRLGGYCLLHQPDIPGAVTIDESVAIAKQFGGEESYRFVNGVLDAIHKHRAPVRGAGEGGGVGGVGGVGQPLGAGDGGVVR